jgi:hypothetical protein
MDHGSWMMMIGVNQLPGPAKSSAIDRAPIPPPNDVAPQIARGRGGVGKETASAQW